MKTIDDVREAFAVLPERVTAAQIAEATGRKHINNWTPDPTFPGEVARSGRTIYRDRDAVLKWYAAQSFSRADRSGPRNLAAQVLAARPARVLMDFGELAELLHLTRRAVYKYAERYPAGEVADPFPPTDYDGKTSWSQVRAWLLRHNDPIPQPDEHGTRVWAEVRAWLMKHAADGAEPRADGTVYLDELGLTVGQRDVIERARIARASGIGVPSEWLAEAIHLEEPGQAEWLAELLDLEDAGRAALRVQDTPVPQEPRRMRPTALARELGLKASTIKYFARTYTPGTSEDPFPEKDSSSAYDVAEAREWLIRNRKLPVDQSPPAGA
ncbi:hypothetical protein [Streptomyces marianii]|uniref:Helix-turn-helix domain-containing protein n=1 Tax=Streptomyces marianii TaxID=1817406 RepID=A0A5R9DTW5_9ACTN|nr:hypothetical protein [Streptomyces marianii]TLQ39211.1 hypothetical protein FEF34_38075 [Streptomyces marianii]